MFDCKKVIVSLNIYVLDAQKNCLDDTVLLSLKQFIILVEIVRVSALVGFFFHI